MSEATTDGLRGEVETAAAGLLYTSEGDHPLTWFTLPGGAATWPMDAATFAASAGAPAAPAEEVSIDRFFARHIESADPADAGMQGVRPRFEALKSLLSNKLRDTRVFRLGSVDVQCYVVGDDGAGNVAGVRTVSVET
ncbi:MAG TPA: nuclease A inhibitor family protein [Longimicrobium sp.]|nr:nuclease A inhibitor family protein [Longimicrobium sp.]